MGRPARKPEDRYFRTAISLPIRAVKDLEVLCSTRYGPVPRSVVLAQLIAAEVERREKEGK